MTLACSFCEKTQWEVGRLVTSQDYRMGICDACIFRAMRIILASGIKPESKMTEGDLGIEPEGTP